MDHNKLAEIRTAEEWLEGERAHQPLKPFGSHWGIESWGKWSTISFALYTLPIPPGARILDVGCGDGWTTAFLALSGYTPTGVDLAPARIQAATERAQRWGIEAEFLAADMDSLALSEQFDAALVYDALHHSARQATVIANVARHVRPGGWVLFGEPSWLHAISPEARRVTRELGWIERGVTLRSLKRDCRRADLTSFRRYFEPTRPYASRTRGWLWESVRLAAANLAVAPQHSVWLAARRA